MPTINSSGRLGPDTVVDLKQDRPQPARIYDWYLGGKDNYAVDREAAHRLEQAFPTIRLCARTNRQFMHRATAFVASTGIDQFLDIGVGMPAEPNLHQVVQTVTPTSRVVYVDNDPIVLAYARALMTGTPVGNISYIRADIREPDSILTARELHDILDLSRPVCLSLIALMHLIPDFENPYEIVATLMDALAPGSCLVMSHVTSDFTSEIDQLVALSHDIGITAQARSLEQFGRFFTTLHLADPCIAVPHRWRNPGICPSQSMDAKVSLYAAVAHK